MKNSKHSRDFDRRDLLRMGAAGAFAGFLSSAMPKLAASPSTGSQGKLLLIYLRGGYDAVSAIIPFGDYASYSQNRTSVLVPNNLTGSAQPLTIDSNTSFKMHPAMAAMMPIVANGEVVFMPAVGNPTRSGSHFDDQDMMETGTTLVSVTPMGAGTSTTLLPLNRDDGWPTRLAKLACPAGNTLRGASISTEPQLFFQSTVSGDAMPHIQSLLDGSGNLQYTLTSAKPNLDAHFKGKKPSPTSAAYGLVGEFNETKGGSGFTRRTGEAGCLMIDSETEVSSLGSFTPAASNYPFTSAAGPPAHLVALFNTGWAKKFFRELKDALHLLAQSTAKVVGIELGGWDTHSNQGGYDSALGRFVGTFSDRLTVLSQAMRAIYEETNANSTLGSQLTTLVTSEFGRTAHENGSKGTDHGGATCFWAQGKNVLPWMSPSGSTLVYNGDSTLWPTGWSQSMNPDGAASDLVNHKGFVAPGTGKMVFPRTDFRTIFAKVCDKVFCMSPSQIDNIIPGYSAQQAWLHSGITAASIVPGTPLPTVPLTSTELNFL